MLASPQLQNDLDALSKKIDAALSLPDECKVEDCTTRSSVPTSKVRSCKEMLDVYTKDEKKLKYPYTRNILSSFPLYERIIKSKVLEDRKLFEAILHAKIFEDEFEFEKHREKYKGQLVWVVMESPYDKTRLCVMLVSQNQMIYHLWKESIDDIRQEFQRGWVFYKNMVKNNFMEAFGMPECAPDLDKSVSDLQSTVNAGVSSLETCSNNQDTLTISEEMRKVVLDELNSLNLDPRLKQQFEFDFKLLTNKDAYYWRNRLDGLRCSANSAVVTSPDSTKMEQLAQKLAELEKVIANSPPENLSASIRSQSAELLQLSQKVAELEKLTPCSRPENLLSSFGSQSTELKQLSKKMTELEKEIASYGPENLLAAIRSQCTSLTLVSQQISGLEQIMARLHPENLLASIGSQSAELKQLSQRVAEFKKMTASSRPENLSASIATELKQLSQKVAKHEEMMVIFPPEYLVASIGSLEDLSRKVIELEKMIRSVREG